MAKTVDLDRLGRLLDDYRYAFFVTVGADHRAHTTAVVPTYAGGVFDVGTVGRHGRANLAACPGVTLVWPAADVSEYSLIVDGTAALPDDPDAPVLITPVKALLHRPLPPAAPRRIPGVDFDCVPVTERR